MLALGRSGWQARPGGIAFLIHPNRVKKEKRIGPDVRDGCLQNVAATHKAAQPIAEESLGLPACLVQPAIHLIKTPATMIDLAVVYLNRLASLPDGEGGGCAVWNTRQKLGQMDGGITGMANPGQQYFGIHCGKPGNRALGSLGQIPRLGAGKDSGVAANGGKGVRTVATQYTRLAPKGVGGYPQPGALGGGWVKGEGVIHAHRWHHQCAGTAKRPLQRLNETLRSTIYRTDCRQGCVYQ